MIITIQGKTFNAEAVKRITEYGEINCMYPDEVDITARAHFGFLSWLSFPGYTARQLQDEINKKNNGGKNGRLSK